MITIIGTGSWGTALGVVLASNNHDLCFVGLEQNVLDDITSNNCNSKYLKNIKLFDNLDKISVKTSSDLNSVINKNTKAIVIATPSEVFSSIIDNIKNIINNKNLASNNIPIIIASKGLASSDQDTWLSEIIEHKLGNNYPYSILSGPSFAKEVAGRQPTAIVMASKNIDIAKQCAELFHNTWFRVYTRTDVIGVQLGGAVKNVIAFAVGCAEGYGFACNARAALITRGLHEMLALGEKLQNIEHLNINKETIIGLTGLGDLVLTATDNQSRNKRFGVYIGQGLTKEQAINKVEQYVACIESAKLIYSLAKKYNVDMPLTEQAYNILYNNISIDKAIKELSTRPGKSE